MSLYRRSLMQSSYFWKYIYFVDPVVERYFVEKYDKDGDRRLSIKEAAAIQSIGTLPEGATYFRELDRMPNSNASLLMPSTMREVVIPPRFTKFGLAYGNQVHCYTPTDHTYILNILGNVTHLGYHAFGGYNHSASPSSYVLLFPNTPTPPSFASFQEFGVNTTIKGFYVPEESVEAYKKVFANLYNNWYSGFTTDKIKPISEYYELKKKGYEF